MKNSVEKRRLSILLGAIALILVIIPLVILVGNKEDNKYLDEIKEVMNKNQPQVIYISRPTCHFCNLLEPLTNELQKDYSLAYHKINSDEISGSLLNKVLKQLEIDSNTFGTPHMTVVQNGKILGQLAGYDNEANTFAFFQKYGVISADKKLWYTPMSQDELKSSLTTDGVKYVLIGNDREETTLTAKSLLKEIVSSTSQNLYYVELGNESKVDTTATLLGITSTELKLPILIKIENGQIIKADKNTKEAYQEFLK